MKKLSALRLLDLLRGRKEARASREIPHPHSASRQVFTPYDQARLSRQLSDRLAAQQIVTEHRKLRTLRHKDVGPER